MPKPGATFNSIDQIRAYPRALGVWISVFQFYRSDSVFLFAVYIAPVLIIYLSILSIRFYVQGYSLRCYVYIQSLSILSIRFVVNTGVWEIEYPDTTFNSIDQIQG